jgi:hypothetical protein
MQTCTKYMTYFIVTKLAALYFWPLLCPCLVSSEDWGNLDEFGQTSYTYNALCPWNHHQICSWYYPYYYTLHLYYDCSCFGLYSYSSS